MRKKLLAVILSVVMIGIMVPAAAFGADIIASGECGADGSNVTWTLDSDGILTISGTGEMDNFHNYRPTWDSNLESIKTVVIKNGVTSIGDAAFWGAENMTSIEIPDSMTRIGDIAFKTCFGLTSVTIPKSVTSIEQAFYYCSGLTEVNVDPENPVYTSIDGVLINRDKAELVYYPEGKNDKNYTVPDSVKSIGEYAFFKSLLKSVKIPEGVTSIGKGAFAMSFDLESVEIPLSVKSIGDIAFSQCESLKDVYYRGTQDQWADISIGESNEPIKDPANIHYESSMEPDEIPYDLWVNGEQITSANAANILGDEAKSAVYDPASGTLKLKNAAITADNDYGIKYDMPLTIELTGNNTITGNKTGIQAQNGKPLTFTGTGSLEINSGNSDGIVASSSNVTVDGVSITVISNSNAMEFFRGTLTVKNGGSLNLTAGNAGIFATNIIVDDGTITASSASYDGISIASGGSINLIKGSIDASGDRGIIALGSTITVEKDGILTATSETKEGIEIGSGRLTIKGGSVTAQSKGTNEEGIDISGGTITVEGGKLIATSKGRYGILLANGTITAKGGTITAEGGNKAIYFHGEGKVKLENGCKIITPAWYADSEDTEFKNDIMEEKDGTTPAKKVVITKYYDASVDDSVQNGTITIEPEGNVSEGDEVTVTVTPKPGYKVDKIIVTDSEGNEIPVKDGKFIMPAGNVTVSATFKKDGGGASSGGGRSGSVSFILTYETNGGSEIKSESHSAGDNVTLDKTPVKDGYTFTGWYADKECTQKIESITMNSSKTVYAGWDDGTQPVNPDENAPLMSIKIGDTKYQLNGVDMEMDSAPFIDENDRTMLPVRVVANALGISDNDIAWDNETKTASFTRPDGKVVSCTVGENAVKIGDDIVEIDTAPVIANDRIFLPMRALFNAFNVSDEHIIWDGAAKAVTVTKEAIEDIKSI